MFKYFTLYPINSKKSFTWMIEQIANSSRSDCDGF